MRFLSVIFLVACSSQATGMNGGDSGTGDSSSGDGGASDSSSGDSPSNGGPISFPDKCPANNACGGNVVGTWDYTGGCIDSLFAQIKQACPTAQINAMGTVKGTLTFTATTVARNARADASATIVFPPVCTMGLTCTALAATLGPGSSCTGTTSCTCNVTSSVVAVDGDTYTVNGGKITAGGSDYEFCVTGSTLHYSEAGSSPKMAGIFDLAKR